MELEADWAFVGTVIAIMVIFFTLQLPKTKNGNDIYVEWWGNTVHTQSAFSWPLFLFRQGTHSFLLAFDWQARGRGFLPIPEGGIPLANE